MNFAKTERAELCDLFDLVGPDAPTLCEGWTSHDLAAHLWIRESDPLGAPGIMAKPLAGLTEKRMTEAKTRWSFTELVDRLRHGPARLSVFAIPGLDEQANGVEYFIHHEDVRRAGDQPQPPRQLPAEVQDLLWRRLRLMARLAFRSSPVGLTLERSDDAADTLRAVPGSSTVTMIGLPSEILLYGSGRREQAEVRLVGEPDAVQRFGEARPAS